MLMSFPDSRHARLTSVRRAEDGVREAAIFVDDRARMLQSKLSRRWSP